MTDIAPLTERQKTLIVSNVVKACKNIKDLNKTGYNFLYLASGFIAHNNVHGFISFYEDYDLKHDILKNAMFNQWGNFREGEKHYDYYMSKKDVYNRIVEKLV